MSDLLNIVKSKYCNYINSRLVRLLLILFSILAGCHSRNKSALTDLEKDALNGSVKSVSLFASRVLEVSELKKSISIKGKDTINEVTKTIKKQIVEYPLSVTKYTKDGYYQEIERLLNDSVLLVLDNCIPEDTLNTRLSKRDTINYFIHKRYFYTGGRLKSIKSYNLRGEGILSEGFTFNRKHVIDSSFYFNGGFIKSSKTGLVDFYTKTIAWMHPNDSLQFDKNNNLIIDNDIHYYYKKYDNEKNWLEAIKYYDGPKRERPVFLRRAITYY